MEMSGQLHALITLPPRKGLSAHSIGSWVDPRDGTDTEAKRKIPAPAGN